MPPTSLTCLSWLSNVKITLIPFRVFLSCSKRFLSPSGTSLVIEARNKLNLGPLSAQSVNYFCSFTLTTPSSFADLFCLMFSQHFSLLNFPCNILFHFLSLPLVSFLQTALHRPSGIFPVLLPHLHFWRPGFRLFFVPSWANDFGDPLTCFPWGGWPSPFWVGPCLYLCYLPRHRCFWLHRRLFSFPKKSGLSGGFSGFKASCSCELAKEPWKRPCPSPRLGWVFTSKMTFISWQLECKSVQSFWKVPWWYLLRFSTHFWDSRNTKQALQRFVEETAYRSAVYCKSKLKF